MNWDTMAPRIRREQTPQPTIIQRSTGRRVTPSKKQESATIYEGSDASN